MSRDAERLQKYISRCGHCSRRRAELLIEKGLVRVNSAIVDQLGTRVIPGKDRGTINGGKIRLPKSLTVALHKPAGFITSTHDTHDRLTVMDLLPKRMIESGVLPAGRLDLQTEGLLVLTNDGELLHRVTHPRFECVKEYFAILNRPPSTRELEKLQSGVFLKEVGKVTAKAKLTHVRHRKDGTATLHVKIHEGMKRQVRRMFDVVGIKVTYLKRLAIGGLTLGDLEKGRWRQLASKEVQLLTGDGKGTTASGQGPRKTGEKRRVRPAGSMKRRKRRRSDGPSGQSRHR